MTKRTKHIENLQLSANVTCDATRRFTNSLMKDGDKANACKILLNSITNCKSKIFENNKKESNFSSADVSYPSLSQSSSRSPSVLNTSHKLPHDISTIGYKEQSDQICTNTVRNVEPIVETRKVRVKGSTYQVPLISHIRRRRRVAIHWMLTAAQSKKRSSRHLFSTCLGQELFDSLNREGSSILRRDQMHKLAAHSRAYTRYRWW